MSDVINGVPRELLERAERNLCSGEEAYRTQQDLRAVLTAQPQASAAQSAPDEREGSEQ